MNLIKPFLWFFASALFVTSVSRIGLSFWQWERVEDLATFQTIMLSGLRVDIATLCMAAFLPILVLPFLPGFVIKSHIFRGLLLAWLSLWLWFIVFMETVTPVYMDFFSVRPGRIFFEYLNRPGEVASMLAGGYLTASIIAIIVPLLFTWWVTKHLLVINGRRSPGWLTRVGLLLLIPLLFLGGRSTLGHRPINPSMVAFSQDQLVNDLVLGSGYNLLFAVYSLRHEGESGRDYPEMSTAEIIRTVRETTHIEPGLFLDDETTFHHFGGNPGQNVPLNIVVVVEESLGARFVGSLGGDPVTPNLDRLGKEGIWFTDLYATGIRSARGLEAIVAGFPPSSARSVLKLGKSQNNFYTFAQSLGALGYRNTFYYGGESHFDNMKGFFLNNGFHEAFDINDIKYPEFTATWGASDEDLFNFALEHMTGTGAQEPFFALIFSSSFHSPYEFPDGKIELHEQPKQSKLNAVKYADYAVGEFIKDAKASSLWDNTLFLIVADHDERPRGKSLVPIESYHIPGLILGKEIRPQEYRRVASQIDLMPTMMWLAGASGIGPFVGDNILTLPADYPGRAVMQYGNNHAFMEGDKVVIHRPDLPSEGYRYADKELIAEEIGQSMKDRALAWALLPGLLYSEKLYSAEPPAEQPRRPEIALEKESGIPE